MTKSTLPALTLAVLLTACGGGGSDAPEGPTFDPASLNACELFSAGDALQFNGGKPVMPMSSTYADAAGTGGSLSCSFNTSVATPDQPLVLGLEIKPAKSPKAAARNLESSRGMLKRLGGGEIQEVPNLGDKALFVGGSLHQLHVLKGNLVLVVTSQTDNPAKSLYVAKLIAQRALQRLEAKPQGAQKQPS
jgi:hypothetical protein